MSLRHLLKPHGHQWLLYVIFVFHVFGRCSAYSDNYFANSTCECGIISQRFLHVTYSVLHALQEFFHTFGEFLTCHIFCVVTPCMDFSHNLLWSMHGVILSCKDFSRFLGTFLGACSTGSVLFCIQQLGRSVTFFFSFFSSHAIILWYHGIR